MNVSSILRVGGGGGGEGGGDGWGCFGMIGDGCGMVGDGWRWLAMVGNGRTRRKMRGSPQKSAASQSTGNVGCQLVAVSQLISQQCGPDEQSVGQPASQLANQPAK